MVVFVPGFMGSTLVCEDDRFGLREVWGENLFSNANIVLSAVRDLSSQGISPGRVLRWLRIGRKKRPYDVYGDLLEFCTAPHGLALKEYASFFPFPYDWRLGVLPLSNRLEEFIARIDRTGQRAIAFVAHSMGGLIVRALLCRFPEIAERTRLLFQIATPVAGTQKAYGCLRDRLRFSQPLDLVIDMVSKRKRLSYADFREVALSFQSLYDLLPRGEDTLTDISDGVRRSVFEERYWPALSLPLLQEAREVQSLMALPVPCAVECVYSDCHDTVCHHHVRRDGSVKTSREYRVGDGTVTFHSAREGSEGGQRHCKRGRHTTHVAMCGNTEVHEVLRSSLERHV